MKPPLLADTVDVDPFSGVDIPTLWIVCIIAFFVFALAALYLNFLRRAAYDDRSAWNYAVAMVLSGVLSGAALVVVLNGIFNGSLRRRRPRDRRRAADLLRPEQLDGQTLVTDEAREEPAGEVIAAVEGGVRVFWVTAPTMQDLVSRLAVVLGEHTGGWTQLHFEYSAFMVLRQLSPAEA